MYFVSRRENGPAPLEKAKAILFASRRVDGSLLYLRLVRIRRRLSLMKILPVFFQAVKSPFSPVGAFCAAGVFASYGVTPCNAIR